MFSFGSGEFAQHLLAWLAINRASLAAKRCHSPDSAPRRPIFKDSLLNSLLAVTA
jgi:hypothetical protein